MAEVPEADLPTLVAKLDELNAEFVNAYYARRGHWRFYVGPLRLTAKLNSLGIAHIYALFCALCFIAGAVLAVFSTTKELGVALVVGAIFAGSSFVSQWWTVQVAKETEDHREVYGPEEVRRLRELLHQREQLAARIERIRPGYFEEAR